MATDNSPPRLKLIITIAIITVVTLLSLNFMLTSYYGYMSDDATRSKLAPTTDKDEQKKNEAAALAGIDKAMKDIGAGQRTTPVEQSTDIGPMTGWSKLPKAPPAPPSMMPHPPSGDMIMPAGDGGVMTGGVDGGPATDAGTKAPPAPAPKH